MNSESTYIFEVLLWFVTLEYLSFVVDRKRSSLILDEGAWKAF